VIAVDLDDRKLELAKKVGAKHVINSKTSGLSMLIATPWVRHNSRAQAGV
jgi:Zn-dependent alcohol dehydrogenase